MQTAWAKASLKTRAKTRAAARSARRSGSFGWATRRWCATPSARIAARVGVVERAVHRDVRLEEAMVCDRGLPWVALGRGPRAQEVGVRREDVRLVDRDPLAAKVAERAYRFDGEARQPGREIVREEPTAIGHPLGEGEVVERYHRANAGVNVGAEDRPVVIERRRVERSGARLDASPLDGEPRRVQPHCALQGDVVAKSVPGVARDVDRVAVLHAAVLCEPVPVDRRAVPLDLGGAGGRAEAEALGEVVHAESHTSTRADLP